MFGYKRHDVADVYHTMIRAGSVPPASFHDVQEVVGFLDNIPKKGPVHGDRGYGSTELSLRN